MHCFNLSPATHDAVLSSESLFLYIFRFVLDALLLQIDVSKWITPTEPFRLGVLSNDLSKFSEDSFGHEAPDAGRTTKSLSNI